MILRYEPSSESYILYSGASAEVGLHQTPNLYPVQLAAVCNPAGYLSGNTGRNTCDPPRPTELRIHLNIYIYQSVLESQTTYQIVNFLSTTIN